MVSSIDGSGSVSKVLQQQRQQITDQQEDQRIKDQQQEVNRQAQEDRATASSRNDPDDRKGRSVDISA
jgi:Spy/CpxP family protein refolding chaperone